MNKYKWIHLADTKGHVTCACWVLRVFNFNFLQIHKCMQHSSASGKWASCVFWTSPAATNVILKKENQSITIKSLQFYENGEQITNKSHQDFTDMICFGFFHTVMFYKVIKYNICGLCKSLACIKYFIEGTCLVSVTFQSWITVYS